MKNYLRFFSFALLASCAVGPDYERPQFFSDAEVADSLKLTSAAQYNIPTDWYTMFDDSALNALVLQSLEQSPDANAAVARLKQARAQLRINSVQYFPTVDVDGSYHYTKNSRNIGYALGTDYYQAGLDASWELDIWGGGRRLTESSEALYKAAAADVDSVRLSLTAEVAANYVNMRMAQEQLRIAGQNLELQQDILNVVNDKYKAGLADDGALNQAKYAVETTKSLIPDLKSNIESYRNALETLTGKLPGTMQNELEPADVNIVRKKFKYDINNLHILPADVIRARPDVRISEQKLISENALVGQALSKLYPSVSLSGFLGFQSLEPHNLFSSKSNMYTYSPAVNLPLLHWGALTAAVDIQKASAEEALYSYQNTLLNAAAEIKNAMVSVEQEYDKNRSSRSAVIAQKQVLDITFEKYRSGLIDFSQLLTAEQDLLSSQNAMIASNAAILQKLIGFYKAIGGGYKGMEEKSRPEWAGLGCCAENAAL